MAFDTTVANQLSVQILTAAINQQQLNAAQARNMVASSGSVLTLSVQLTHLSGLQHIFGLTPFDAAATANLQAVALPTHIAGIQTGNQAPGGQ